MSFIGVATAIGLEGIAANIAAGAMMGGSVKVGTNVLSGQKPFKDVGEGILLGGLTGGIAPSVSSAFDLSMPTAMGITQGGLTYAATGDINRALMSGLGAYGAAGLAEGFGGGNVRGEQVFGDVQAAEGSLGDKFNDYLTGPNAGDKPFTAPGAGSGSGNFLKDNAKYIGALAGPAITAGLNVQKGLPQTTTAPATAAYRPYSYDPYGGTYESLGVYPINPPPEKAADGGLMGMADGGYNPGQLDFTQRSEPVVRMAGGGLNAATFKEQMYAGGLDDSAATKRGLELAAAQGLNAQQTTDLWNEALGTKFTPDDYARVAKQYGVYGPQANIDFVKNLATDTSTAADFGREVNARGLSQQDVNTALLGSGLSGAAQFALTNQNIGDTANTSETYGGLKGLSNNINYWLKQHPGASLNDIKTEMAKWDLTDEDFQRATGKTAVDYATGDIKKVENLALGASGNNAAVVNPNGTVTQTALGNVAINPVTGERAPTTTIQNIKDLYTAGGGSLGYTVNAPKNMQEFNQRFNTMTGGSKQAYDYLTGKAPYSPTPYTPTGEVMRPYAESVLGMPANLANKKYIFDPATKQYKANPDYQPYEFDKTTGTKTRGMSSNQVLAGLKALPNPADDLATYNWMVANKLTPAQVAAALGVPLSEIQAKYNRYAGNTGSTGVDANLTDPSKKPTTSPGTDKAWSWDGGSSKWIAVDLPNMAGGGLSALAGGGMSNLGSYSDGGRLLRGPGDGVSDSIPAVIGRKQPARLADGEFVVPARIVSELGNGSTEAGARKLYAMMDRVQKARRGTVGKGRVAKNSRSEKYLPA